MAFLVGRPVEKVTIEPAQLQTGGGRLGACKIQKGRSKATRDSVEDEVLILFAGMVAESHQTKRYSPAGAQQDLMSVSRLLANRAKNEKQSVRLQQRLLAKTEHILSESVNATAIRLIADELLKRSTISGRAVRHFVEQAQQAAE